MRIGFSQKAHLALRQDRLCSVDLVAPDRSRRCRSEHDLCQIPKAGSDIISRFVGKAWSYSVGKLFQFLGCESHQILETTKHLRIFSFIW
jgi:hypothetical protein